MWYDYFRIGDGQRYTDESAPPIYRSYARDCGIIMDEEIFNETKDVLHRTIYEVSDELKSIMFTPEITPKQSTSEYYFLKLDVKFPRGT